MGEEQLDNLLTRVRELLDREIPDFVTGWTISIETNAPDYEQEYGERNLITMGQGSVFTQLGLLEAAKHRLITAVDED